MNKKWEFYKPDEELVSKIAKKHNISEVLATVLVNRNIIDDERNKNILRSKKKRFP